MSWIVQGLYNAFFKMFRIGLPGGSEMRKIDQRSKNNLQTNGKSKFEEEAFTVERLPGITNENKEQIKRLVELFYKDDPITAAFRVADNRKVSQPMINLLLADIEQGVSVIAIHKQTKEIIGLLVNAISYGHSSVESIFAEVEDEREKELLHFWKTHGWYDTTMFNLEYSVVDPRYRNLGISEAVGIKSLELAKELKQTYIRTHTTNAFNAAACEKYGFNCVSKFAYADIRDSKGRKVFLKIAEPHTHLKLYCIKVVGDMFVNTYESKNSDET